MSELPKGWVEAKLPDVCDVLDYARIPVNSEERAKRVGPYPYYGANGQAGTIDDFLFDGEHILLAEDGGFFDQPGRGVAYLVDGRFWVNNHAHILRVLGGAPPSLLVNHLNRIDWRGYASGTTRLKLTQGAMLEVPVTVPPLNEQRRIVAKLDVLLGRSKRAKEELAAIPALLERYRQSVLAAAFRGDLTADWRQSRRSELVEEQREARPTFLTDRSVDVGSPVTVGLWDGTLPEGWKCVPIDSLARLESGHTPRKSVSEYWNGDVPWISLRDIRQADGSVITDTESMPTMLGIENSSARLLPAGTVVFSRDISVGYACVMGRSMATSQHFANWVCGPDLCNMYLMHALIASRQNLIQSGQGTTVKTIFYPALHRLHIRIPCIEEQALIAERIQTMQEQMARLGSVVEAQTTLNELDRAILTRAFRGELVPQDPADEPATVLLERIRAERASAPPAARRGRRPAAR